MPILPKKGEIYIGAIIALGIFIILSQSVFTLTSNAFDLVSYTRARATAQALANEKMELVRNLPYEDVGTVGGIPAGPLPQEEKQRRNGLEYSTKTSVIYVDDPFDNIAPIDTLATDYKTVRVDVSWGGIAASGANTITLITNVAPKGIESIAGGGTLSILVFDSQGLPVSQANVTISAPSLNPPINLNLQTSATGRVVLPGAPACSGCYEITATKPTFSTDRTYSTSEVTNPTKPHQTILETQVTEISFAIDAFARLDLASVNDRDNFFAPLPNQIITMRGNKVIGTDSLDNPVYKFDLDLATDGAGTLSIEELEWDTYTISLPPASTKDIAGTNPLSPFSVAPQEDIDLFVALANESTHSLLAVFTDQAGAPIASASATLTDSGTFNENLISGQPSDPDFGQAFFKSLSATTYDLAASASGFIDTNFQIPVANYTREIIILTPQ